MGGHTRSRTTGRIVIAAVLGTVLAATVLVGVGIAAPTDALPLPAAPSAPAGPGLPGAPADPGLPAPDGDAPAPETPGEPGEPGEPTLPALPAVPQLPAIDPQNTGPALPQLPALPANPLDPVNGLPQLSELQGESEEVGEDEPAQPAPESGAFDDGTGIRGTPCSGEVSACVDLTTLQSWLIVDGEVRRGPVPVRVGDELGPTPVGRFRVQWKDIDHVSSELGTPMPYAVFFADGGIGFHEGDSDSNSAGCVKLSHDDAVAWYYALQIDDGVQVVRTSPR